MSHLCSKCGGVVGDTLTAIANHSCPLGVLAVHINTNRNFLRRRDNPIKPHLIKLFDHPGWICVGLGPRLIGTINGVGLTPRDAYDDYFDVADRKRIESFA